jgi:hypothetical protein
VLRYQDWDTEMIGLLCEALKTTRLCPQGLTRSQSEDFRSRYEIKLREGWKLNPPDPPDPYPGPTLQTDTVNLLRRLQDGADVVLRFTRDPRVPFTNNEAGREVACRRSNSRSREASGLQQEHRPSVSFVPVPPL